MKVSELIDILKERVFHTGDVDIRVEIPYKNGNVLDIDIEDVINQEGYYHTITLLGDGEWR